MLKVLNEQTLSTISEMYSRFPDCILVFIMDDPNSDGDIRGYLYCVSESKDSINDLCHVAADLNEQGKHAVIAGSYNKGGTPGVQAYSRK